MTTDSIKQRYDIVGNDPKLLLAINKANQVAPTDLSILITGESGVGKDVFSSIVHDNSLRKSKKLVSVNCGAIPEGTIESELFGHLKGSFTGADKDRKGYFEEANDGTIFLDEVGELPLQTQVKLLRVLENGETPCGQLLAQEGECACGGSHQRGHPSGCAPRPFPRGPLLPSQPDIHRHPPSA